MGICCCKKFFRSDVTKNQGNSNTTNEISNTSGSNSNSSSSTSDSNNSNSSSNSNYSNDLNDSNIFNDSSAYYQSSVEYKKYSEENDINEIPTTTTDVCTTIPLQYDGFDHDTPIPTETQKIINNFLAKKHSQYRASSKKPISNTHTIYEQKYFKELSILTRDFKILLKKLIKTRTISIFLCNCLLATCEDPLSDNQDFSMDNLLVNFLPLMIDTNSIPDNLNDCEKFILDNKNNLTNLKIAKLYYKANIFNQKNKRNKLKQSDQLSQLSHSSSKTEISELSRNIKNNEEMLVLFNVLS
jgi:hypothetical protein